MTLMIKLSRGSQKSFNFPPPKFGLLRVSARAVGNLKMQHLCQLVTMCCSYLCSHMYVLRAVAGTSMHCKNATLWCLCWRWLLTSVSGLAADEKGPSYYTHLESLTGCHIHKAVHLSAGVR